LESVSSGLSLRRKEEGRVGDEPSPAMGACQAGNVLDDAAAEAVVEAVARRSLGIAGAPLRPLAMPGKAVATPARTETRRAEVGAMVFESGKVQ